LFANLWVILLVMLGIASAWTFLAFGSLWPAFLAVRKFQGKRTLPEMMTGLMHVAQTNTAFGILFLVGLLAGAF
jgi:1,4-dihydroxy-2-naphthoate octaprenyltransferase